MTDKEIHLMWQIAIVLLLITLALAMFTMTHPNPGGEWGWKPITACLHYIDGKVTSCGVTETAAVHATQTAEAAVTPAWWQFWGH